MARPQSATTATPSRRSACTSPPAAARSSRSRPPARACRVRPDSRRPLPCRPCRCPRRGARACRRARFITRASRSRSASMIVTNCGLRWPSTGAASARITRGVTRLGPGPKSRRSVDGSGVMRVEQCGHLLPDERGRVGRHRPKRRPRRSTGQAARVHGGLEPGNAVERADGLRDRHEAQLKPARLVVPPCLDRCHQSPRRRRARRPRDRSSRRWRRRRATRKRARRSRQDGEAGTASRHEVGNHRDVAARVLDADDVRMRRQRRRRVGRQVDAGEDGDVVEDDRHRRRVGHARVERDDRVGCSSAPLKNDGVRTITASAPRAAARAVAAIVAAVTRVRCRRSATCPSGHPTARRLDQRVRFIVVQQRRLAVAAEHDDAGQRGRGVVAEVRRERRRDRSLRPERASSRARRCRAAGDPMPSSRLYRRRWQVSTERPRSPCPFSRVE